MDDWTDDDLLIPHRHSGRAIMRVGVQAQLYFPAGHERRVRLAAIDALGAYAELAGGHLRRIRSGDGSRDYELGAGDILGIERRAAEGARSDEVFGLSLIDELELHRWHATAQLIGEGAKEWLSYFYSAVPPSFIKGDPDRYVEAVAGLASILRPDYGSAGFALIGEIGMELQRPHESWAMLSRFSGLDFFGAFNLKAKPRAIQSVNWLTILGGDALRALGGREVLEARLRAAWAALSDETREERRPLDDLLYEYDGGVIVRAGRLPQMGDRLASGAPEAFIAAYEALSPIVFRGYGGRVSELIKLPPGLDRREETLGWITRFEREGASMREPAREGDLE